ncbi:MAG: tRNA lysidine(34) synthetase TilS [Ignavibacteriales bacterium]|nr:tRNA lysidine(34) synthetase TilS [Ignavibacteriales bacterium]
MKKTEQKVLRFIEQNKLISAGDKILVAFSGGPDSVFALHFLDKFKRKYKVDLYAVHFNHGLRGKESDADEIFSKEFCKKRSIPLDVVKLNVKSFSAKNKISIEEAARNLRYNNLLKLAEKTGSTKIVTAHNQSDNTETILLNLFSGTGFSGFSGIPIQRGNIIRPFLCLTKQEISNYLDHEKISFRIDSSNMKDDYKRNYIRNRILPLVRMKLNLAVDEALFRSSKNFENTLFLNHKLIDHIIAEYVTHNSNAVSFPLLFADLFEGKIPGDILKIIFKRYLNHEFEYDDYIKINSLITKQKGKKIQLSKKLIASREEESIRIELSGKTSNNNFTLKTGDQINLGSKVIGIELAKSENVQFKNNGKVEFISADGMNENFILRTWKFGDKFKPLGMKNFKKVSDFLTDLKISVKKKKNQLVLTNRDQIVWIVGLRIDDRYKLNSKTKKIYKLWVK